MKKIIVVLICMTIAYLTFFTETKSGKIRALKNQYELNQSKNMESSSDDIYSSLDRDYVSSVAPMLIRIGEDLFDTSLSRRDIMNAKLSDPMPIFISKEKYGKGEDFYSKLQVRAWMFIVYYNNSPISVVTTDFENRIEVVNSIYGQEFAISMDNALNKIDRKGAVVIPAEGYFFVADDADNVALASIQNGVSARSGLKGFNEFNRSVNKAINYNNSQEELVIGGSILLETLYGYMDDI